MIEKWYRGHEGDRYATDNFGIIWLADDPDYAKLYADEYPNGIVSTLFIDMRKLKYLDWYYNEDFDPYDPDMSLIKEYMREEGCNAYTFPLNNGTTVLALLSMEPIVKVSLYNDKEDNSVEQVGVNEIRYMVKEVINKIFTNKK